MSKYWTDPLNPCVGCTPVSPACNHCYAAKQAWGFLQSSDTRLAKVRADYAGTATEKGWTGKVTWLPHRLEVLKHKHKPRVWFVGNMTDLWHPAVPEIYRHEVLSLCRANLEDTFLFCTKRPHDMAWTIIKHIQVYRLEVMPPHLYFGATAWDQESLEDVSEVFHALPARNWVSLEPLLAPVTLPKALLNKLVWAVAGFESGEERREGDKAWLRPIRDALYVHNIPFFFKQGNSRLPGGDDLLDGARYHQTPFPLPIK